jgi:hypothetical protein
MKRMTQTALPARKAWSETDLGGERLDGLQVEVVVEVEVVQVLAMDQQVEHVVPLPAHLRAHPRVQGGGAREERRERIGERREEEKEERGGEKKEEKRGEERGEEREETIHTCVACSHTCEHREGVLY